MNYELVEYNCRTSECDRVSLILRASNIFFDQQYYADLARVQVLDRRYPQICRHRLSRYLPPLSSQPHIAMATPVAMLSRPGRRALPATRLLVRQSSTSQGQNWAGHPFDVAKDNVAQLAASPRRALTLADLLK